VVSLLLSARDRYTPLSSYDKHARASAVVVDLRAENSEGLFAQAAARRLQPNQGFKQILALTEASKDALPKALVDVVRSAPAGSVLTHASTNLASFLERRYPVECQQAVCYLDVSRVDGSSSGDVGLRSWCTVHNISQPHTHERETGSESDAPFDDWVLPLTEPDEVAVGAGAPAVSVAALPQPSSSFKSWLASLPAEERARLHPANLPAKHVLLLSFLRFVLLRNEGGCPLFALLWSPLTHRPQELRPMVQHHLDMPDQSPTVLAIFQRRDAVMTMGPGGAVAVPAAPSAAASAAHAAASSSSAPVAQQRQEPLPRPVAVIDDGLPVLPSASRLQLASLYLSRLMPPHAHLYQRLLQILGSQLWNCPQSVRMLHAEFERLVSTPRSRRHNQGGAPPSQQRPPLAESYSAAFLPDAPDDEEIYDQLRLFFHRTIVPSAEYQRKLAADRRAQTGEGVDGRANSRVQEITTLLAREHFAPRYAMLDVGCSEGSITAALGSALGLHSSSIHGCDVRDVPSPQGFTFALSSGARVPYADAQFDFVVALMVLHHFDELPAMLAELRRVTRPGGLLLIREHDCTWPSLSMLIDVMHGLYARTWKDPPEQPHFCDTYYAHYRRREEWTELLRQAGFSQCASSPDRNGTYREPLPRERLRVGQNIKNPFAFYYGLYRRDEEGPPDAAGGAAAAAGGVSGAAAAEGRFEHHRSSHRDDHHNNHHRHRSRSRSRERDHGYRRRHEDDRDRRSNRRGSPTGRDRDNDDSSCRRTRSRSRSRDRDQDRDRDRDRQRDDRRGGGSERQHDSSRDERRGYHDRRRSRSPRSASRERRRERDTGQQQAPPPQQQHQQ
jgi:ubiquinone/menaquinone biosynthesis C-methylase UbiE